MNKDEVELLRQEIEMLMSERTHLLKVVGAAAVLVSNTDVSSLPSGAVEAAEMLSETLNELHEETLKDALESIHAEPDKR
jgi:ATP-dependent protease HslVU (ClpYQ) peptidase subunit